MNSENILPTLWDEGGVVFRRGVIDDVTYVVVEQRLPTEREYQIIRERELGLQLMGQVSRNEGLALGEHLPHLRYLHLTGVDLNLTWLPEMRNLVRLDVNGTVARTADLACLEQLVSYGGTLDKMESVLACPNLVDAYFWDVRHGELGAIPQQLRRLHLTDLQGTRSLVSAGRSPRLEELTLTGARHFDLRSLEPFQNLRVLSLEQVVGVSGVETLLSLSRLSAVHLESCRDIANIGRLIELKSVEIHVWGRGKFASLLKSIAGSAPNWQFH